MPWGAIIGGLTSLGTSAINQGISGANTSRARAWQSEMYSRQLRDQLKYNSPSFQVAQMKNSGLNPYLLSDGLTNYSSSVPGAPPVAHGQLDSRIPLDTARAVAEIENISADTDNKRANTEGTLLDNTAKSIINEYLPERQQQELAEIVKRLGLMDSQKELTEAQADKAYYEMLHTISSIYLTDTQKKKLEAELTLLSLNTEYQKAINGYKIPLLQKGVDPEKGWQDNLAKLVVQVISDPDLRKKGILPTIIEQLLK